MKNAYETSFFEATLLFCGFPFLAVACVAV